jgi:putative membrane protein
MGFLIRVLVNALAILLAVNVVPGIEATGLVTILGAGLVLGLINAVVRPVLLILTLPLTLVTLGLFLVILNAFCLWLTSAVVKGFEVRGFWAAVLGALVISAVSWCANGFVSDRGRVVVITDRPPGEEPRRPPRRIN